MSGVSVTQIIPLGNTEGGKHAVTKHFLRGPKKILKQFNIKLNEALDWWKFQLRNSADTKVAFLGG